MKNITRKLVFSIVTITSLLLTGNIAQAAVIASFEFDSNGAVRQDNPSFSGLSLYVELVNPGATAGTGHALFESSLFQISDVGLTLTANAGNDPDFSNFVAYATNGIDNPLKLWNNGFFRAVGTRHESNTFTGTGFTGPDLAGSTIDSITLTLDAISIGDAFGLSNNVLRWQSTINFNGSISSGTTPEPSILALFFTGILGLGFATRRKLRRS